VLAWGIATVALSCTLVYHALDVVNGHRFPPSVVGSIVGLTYVGVGALIASRWPRNPIGWIYLVCLALISFGAPGNLADQYAIYGTLTDPGSLPGPEWIVWAGHVALSAFFPALLVFSVLLFPDGRLPSPRWRPVGTFAGVAIVALTIETAFQAFGPPMPLGLQNPVSATGALGDLLPVARGATFFLILGALGAAIVAIVGRFRRATGIERQQLRWFAYGAAWIPGLLLFAVVLSAVLPRALSGGVGNELWPLSAAGIPVATGIAILRYRLYDIDVLINRTLVYGATTAAIAVAFFAGIVVLQALLRPLTSGSEIAVAASTLASVALFQPLRRRIRDAVDRRFYRARYDAARTLDAFSIRLRDEVELGAVRAELVGAVRDTVQPAHVSVWLRGR
jgi:hypothetical protein